MTPEEFQRMMRSNPQLRISKVSKGKSMDSINEMAFNFKGKEYPKELKGEWVQLPSKKRKYGNVKTNGFDSKKESDRNDELELMQKNGLISNLEKQKTFVLQEGFVNNWGKKIRPMTYKADFYYEKDGRKYVEDVKSKGTITRVYLNKRKMFEYIYRDVFFLET